MLKVENCCLVLIDVQGKLAELMFEKEKLFGNLERLVKGAKVLGLDVLWCEQYRKALGPTIEPLAEILEGDEPVDKFSFSCVGDEAFREKLKAVGHKHMILCGIESHVCVYQTAMDLLDGDYDVTVVADAVSSRTAENKEIAIRRLEAEGANISSVEMLLFELMGDAKHEKFKEISKLVR